MTPTRLASLLVAAGLLAAPAEVLAAPAHAATTYTWTAGFDVLGADHHSWGDPLNWSPQAVPRDGDSVIVPAIPAEGAVPVDGIPTIELENLTVAGSDESAVRLGEDGDSITVDGSFSWTGGRITSDVTIADGATGRVSSGQGKNLWGHLTVLGDLTLAGSTFGISWNHEVTVEPGGSLTSTGSSQILTDRCCGGDPDQLVNRGKVDVTGGTLTLDHLGLRQSGTMHVASGAKVKARGGPARLAPGAIFSGGGRLAFDHTPTPEPDADNPDLFQGGVYLQGTSRLADGFTLALDAGSNLSGTGSVAGSGTLALSGATVYADVAVASGVRIAVGGPLASGLRVWDDDLPGYHARVATAGPISVASGAELDTNQGTLLHLRRGARLDLPGGATLGSGTCCSSAPQITADAGSTLRLGGATGTAHVNWVNLSTSGDTSVPAGAHVVVDEGPLVQHGGRTTLGTGSSLKLTRTTMKLAGGTLRGTGIITGKVLNYGGTVNPGTSTTPAALAIRAYQQGKGGTLSVDTAYRKADRLVVAGTAQLAGRVLVHGTAGPRGTKVAVVTARWRKGRFTRVSLGPWPTVAYAARSVSLVR